MKILFLLDFVSVFLDLPRTLAAFSCVVLFIERFVTQRGALSFLQSSRTILRGSEFIGRKAVALFQPPICRFTDKTDGTILGRRHTVHFLRMNFQNEIPGLFFCVQIWSKLSLFRDLCERGDEPTSLPHILQLFASVFAKILHFFRIKIDLMFF
jgi:hypothetical protein